MYVWLQIFFFLLFTELVRSNETYTNLGANGCWQENEWTISRRVLPNEWWWSIGFISIIYLSFLVFLSSSINFFWILGENFTVHKSRCVSSFAVIFCKMKIVFLCECVTLRMYTNVPINNKSLIITHSVFMIWITHKKKFKRICFLVAWSLEIDLVYF